MKNILLLVLILTLCFESKAQTPVKTRPQTYQPTPLDRVKNYVQDIADESYSVKTNNGWVIRYRPTGRKNYKTIGHGPTELKAWRDAKRYIDGRVR